MNIVNRKEEPPKRAIEVDDLETVEYTLNDIDRSWLSLLRLSELLEQHSEDADTSTAAYFLKVASREIEANVKHVRACLKEEPQ